MKKPVFLALAPAAAAIVLGGCGGGSSSTAKAPAASGGRPAPTVELSSSKLGPILTDGHGRTLYLFEADKGTTSACYSACTTTRATATRAPRPARASISSAPRGTSSGATARRSTVTDLALAAVRPRPAPRWRGGARLIGALALLAVGGVHLEQYTVAHFSVIPTIGSLFLADFVVATAAALLLLALATPVLRRVSPLVEAIVALAGSVPPRALSPHC